MIITSHVTSCNIIEFGFVGDIPGTHDTDIVSVYSEYLEEPDMLLTQPDRGGKARHVNINAKPITPLDKVTVPISLTLSVMVGYICGGAILFGQWEGKFSRSQLLLYSTHFN